MRTRIRAFAVTEGACLLLQGAAVSVSAQIVKKGVVLQTQSIVSRVLIVLLIGLCSPGIGLAQEQQEQAGGDPAPAQEQQEQEGGDLAQQARNPTAALTMFQVVASHVAGFRELEDADMTSVIVMPVIPFTTGKLQHIARITLPIVANGPDWGLLAEGDDQTNVLPPGYIPTAEKAGLGDTAMFDLLIFPAPWKGGRIAAGVSAILPTATDPALGTEKWSVGPAVGALVQSGGLLLGGIALANFSVAGNSEREDVRTMAIQPFGSYGLGSGWSIEFSEMMFSRDFTTGAWGSIPLGARVGKLATFGSLPVRFYGDAEYNFADTGVTSRWTFRFAFVPLF